MMTSLWLIIILSLSNDVNSFWINESPCISKSLNDYISPTGHTVINVATVQELDAAMYTPVDHTTILIADGIYDISSLANKRLQIAPGSNADDIIIRSASGIRENVILTGAGQYNSAAVYGIELFPCSNVVIADLTIKNVYYHTIQIHGGCSNILLHNLHLIDAGEQIVKVSSGGMAGIPVPELIIQFTLFELTNGWDAHPELGYPYGNGILAHNTTGLHIRDCQFVNLYYTCEYIEMCVAGPSILVWNYARDSIIERNLFYKCARGVQFGSTNSPHYNGIIKNNFFYRPVMSTTVDAAFYIESPNSIIAFNTIYVSGSYYAPIQIRYDTTTNVLVANNILDSGAVTISNNADAITTNNFVGASDSAYYQDLTSGDLHLVDGYSGVINNIIGKGRNIDGIVYDIDHETINLNSIDIGADQISSSGACIVTNSPTTALPTMSTPTTNIMTTMTQTENETAVDTSNTPTVSPFEILYYWIIKDSANCGDGYTDLNESNNYYGVYCVPCADNSAGTYGQCFECDASEQPNHSRTECIAKDEELFYASNEFNAIISVVSTLTGCGCLCGLAMFIKNKYFTKKDTEKQNKTTKYNHVTVETV